MYGTIKDIENVEIDDQQSYAKNTVIAGCYKVGTLLYECNFAYRQLQRQAIRLDKEDAEHTYEVTASLQHAGDETTCELELSSAFTPEGGDTMRETMTKAVFSIKDGTASYWIDYMECNRNNRCDTKHGSTENLISQFTRDISEVI